MGRLFLRFRCPLCFPCLGLSARHKVLGWLPCNSLKTKESIPRSSTHFFARVRNRIEQIFGLGGGIRRFLDAMKIKLAGEPVSRILSAA
jgi:hypothetical protein